MESLKHWLKTYWPVLLSGAIIWILLAMMIVTAGQAECLGMGIYPGKSPHWPTKNEFTVMAKSNLTHEGFMITVDPKWHETPQEALERTIREENVTNLYNERAGTLKRYAAELWDAGYRSTLTYDLSCPGPGGLSYDSDWLAYMPTPNYSVCRNAVALEWSRTVGNGVPERATPVSSDPNGNFPEPCGLYYRGCGGPHLVGGWFNNAHPSCDNPPDPPVDPPTPSEECEWWVSAMDNGIVRVLTKGACELIMEIKQAPTIPDPSSSMVSTRAVPNE